MRSTDLIFVPVRITGTIVEGNQNAILVNLGGGAEGVSADIAGGGESASREPFYGVVGFVVRPEPPSISGQAEAIAYRADDGLGFLCSRDIRLSAFVSLDVGEMAIVQYGGGFVGLSYAANRKGTKVRLSAPNGLPVPASHEFVMDPGGVNPKITLTHLAGALVELANAFARIDAADIIAGDSVSAKSVALADPLLAVMKAILPILSPLVATALANGAITPDVAAAYTAAATLYLAGGGKTTKLRAV